MSVCSVCWVEEEYLASGKHGKVCQSCVLYAEAWFRRNSGPVKLELVAAL